MDNYQKEHRYYISDLLQQAKSFNESIRSYQGTENRRHRILDVAFGKSRSRKQTGNAAECFGILNQLALNPLKTTNTIKAGMKHKRTMAGWDKLYLEQLLSLLNV